MKYTPEEVMQFVQEEDIKFIRLAFCDVYGKQHNVAIMPSELKRAFEFGIAIDASAVGGFGGEIRSDLLLPKQVTAQPATADDLAEISGYLHTYCQLFGGSCEELLRSAFTVITPNSQNPYKQMYVLN